MEKMNVLLAKFWIRVVKSFAHVPLGVRRVIARVVAEVLWAGVPKRRHVTLTNLRLCFPDKTEAERRAIAKSTYVHLAQAALDHGVLWAGSAEAVSKMVTFEGLEIVTKADGPLIIVAPHFAGLDAAHYQRQRNPAWDAAALAGRKRFSDPVLIEKCTGQHDLRHAAESSLLLPAGYGFRG